jgi:hypothetical protein
MLMHHKMLTDKVIDKYLSVFAIGKIAAKQCMLMHNKMLTDKVLAKYLLVFAIMSIATILFLCEILLSIP